MPTTGRRNPWALLAAATAFLLPVAYSPSVYATFWSPKVAVLLVAGAVGLARLPLLLRSEERRTAIAALTFLAIAIAASVLARDPSSAVFGLYNAGTGLVFVAALVGVWALGATIGDQQVLVRRALVGGILVSCAVAIIQSVVDLGLPALVAQGRAAGLAGNAVHLGTVAVAGVALLAHERSRLALAGIVVCGAAVQLSGTRLALLVLLAAIAVIGVRAGWRRLLVLAATTAVALGLSSALASTAGFETATARSDERALSAGGGISVRLEVWAYARHAAVERPALGHGPGRFRAATVGDRTLTVVRAEGSNAVYADAHNLLVEHAVTTGMLGAAALVAWLVLAVRAGRGALAAAALVLLAMSLGQPQSPGTTPLLFLAAGAAVAPVGVARRGRQASLLAVGAATVGVLAGGAVLVGDASLLQLRQDFDLADGRRADTFLRPWPRPAQLLARAHRFESIDAGGGAAQLAEEAESRRWLRVAVDRDPADPGLWTDLADAERLDGLLDVARRHYQEALRRDRYDVRAMRGLAAIAASEGDDAEARSWLELIQTVIDDPGARALLDELG